MIHRRPVAWARVLRPLGPPAISFGVFLDHGTAPQKGSQKPGPVPKKASCLGYCYKVAGTHPPPRAHPPTERAFRNSDGRWVRVLRLVQMLPHLSTTLRGLSPLQLTGRPRGRPATYDRYVAAPCVYAKENVVVPTVERATPYYAQKGHWGKKSSKKTRHGPGIPSIASNWNTSI